jgi:glucan phosphoethanolaminetransferase (alkaline phosphatase superfamily)
MLKDRLWIYSIYLFILLLHYAQFTIHRLTDSSLGLFFNFFKGHGIAHVITVFQAMNMNGWMICIILAAFSLLPLISYCIYKVTAYFIKPKIISMQSIALILLPICLFLFSFEWLFISKMPHREYASFKKTLTLGTTFFAPPVPCSTFPFAVSSVQNQSEILKSFADCKIEEKPNIYLFVIETLRKDFITQDIAPFLSSFEREHISFPSSHANANSTQHSWFSIFHSILPFHWSNIASGSIPLQILKNIGYKIHVYSSADLGYFDMDIAIFGPNKEMATHIEEFAKLPIESWEKDALVMNSFEKEQSESGNIFLFFLDATHSEYSFPPEKCYFKPIVQKIDYLTINVKNIEPIVNRYRNSIRYIDSLIEQFVEKLKKNDLYDKAIIAITGDHGEEFFEEGSLFHGTHLNESQTSVPIVFKFPKAQKVMTETVTHIDIFPSILDYLTGIHSPLFEGKSIFRAGAKQPRFAIAQNGAKKPTEFIVQTEDYFLHARFLDPEKRAEIEILSEKNLSNINPRK